MKTYEKLIGLVVVVGLALIAIPAYAATEASGVVVPEKALIDFQKENAGQKPIVALYKYQEYKRMLRKAPATTLEPSRIREGLGNTREKTLADFQRENAGQKSIVAWHKFEAYKRTR